MQNVADEPSKTGKPPRKPRATRKKARPADTLVSGIKKNKVELAEDDLKKVSGGGGYCEAWKTRIKIM